MSRDRTLLANLAFADPDKQDPLHDLGCQYIARPEVSSLLGLGRPHPEQRPLLEVPSSKGQDQYKTTIGFLDVVLPMQQASTQKCVRPVDHQYEDFPDQHTAWCFYQQMMNYEGVKAGYHNYAEYKEFSQHVQQLGALWRVPKYACVDMPCWVSVSIYVEVKIAHASLGDMLRQINLYDEYIMKSQGGWGWVLAAAFEMSSATVDALRAHNIQPVHLGKSFREWAAAQQALPRAANVLSL